jgi:RHO1 GDP-GTP exchange protein 1/2
LLSRRQLITLQSLLAYHIEALVSSQQNAHMPQTPQKLNGSRDVHFFNVGSVGGRTIVIYMTKKLVSIRVHDDGLNLTKVQNDSVFTVLEPVVEHLNERPPALTSFRSRLGLKSRRSDWFRVHREFLIPSETYDVVFHESSIVVLGANGFEIFVDLLKSVTIPQRDNPRLEKLAKRCASCRPLGMFRSNADEFLLCYNGLYSFLAHFRIFKPISTQSSDCTLTNMASSHARC